MNYGLLPQGVSDAARHVQESTWRGRRHLHESNAFGIESTVRDELATVWEECREPYWDGHDALAVTQDALRNTYLLLEALPFGFPAPSIGAEPDGSLTMEWHRSARRTLSVSVSPDGDLHYAALFGPNRNYGTEVFLGDVPETILDLIRRVYGA